MEATRRPAGITILAILGFISGILLLFGGIFSFIGGTLGALISPFSAAVTFGGSLARVAGGLLGIVVGLFQLYVAYGAWTLQPWAWTWLLVLAIINVIGAVFSLGTNWWQLLINAVIIYYLYTPQVRAAFART